jgi:hypothetical protein
MAWNRAQHVAFRASNPMAFSRIPLALMVQVRLAARERGLSVAAFIREILHRTCNPEKPFCRELPPHARNARGQFRARFEPTAEWHVQREAKRARNAAKLHLHNAAMAQECIDKAANVDSGHSRDPGMVDKPRDR